MRESIARGIAAGVVLGFAKLDVLTPDAQAFLERGTYEAHTPEDQGIRRALADLGYLERRWWQNRYRRTDKPLPNGKGLRQMVKNAVEKSLAEKGLKREDLSLALRNTLQRLGA